MATRATCRIRDTIVYTWKQVTFNILQNINKNNQAAGLLILQDISLRTVYSTGKLRNSSTFNDNQWKMIADVDL